MRINIFILGACTGLIFGCSNPQKKQAGTASPTEAPAQQLTTATQTGQAATPAKVEAQKNELACKRDQETRTLKVEAAQTRGCKLFYSNYSSKDAVAWSNKGNSHCEQVCDRIRGKLEEVGFKCSVEQAQTSAPQTVTQPVKTQTTDAKTEPPKAKN
jgi:hypothetical protein